MPHHRPTPSEAQDLLGGLNPALDKAEAEHKLQLQQRDDRISELEKAVNLLIVYDEWCGDDIQAHVFAYNDAIAEAVKVMAPKSGGKV